MRFIKTVGGVVALLWTGCTTGTVARSLESTCEASRINAVDGWVIADATVDFRRGHKAILVGADRGGAYGVAAFAIVDIKRRQVELTRRFDRTAEAGFEGVAVVNGGWILAATSRGIEGRGEEDAWVVNVDDSGDVTHSATLGGAYMDHASAVVPGPHRSVWVVGTTRSKGASDGSSGWITALDTSLKVRWDRTYGRSLEQGFSGAAPWKGGVIAVGWQRSGASADGSAWLVSISPSGDIRWDKTWRHEDAGLPLNVQHQTNFDGFWLVGRRHHQGWMGRYDTHGTLQWQRTFGPELAGQSVLMSRSWGEHEGILVAGSVLRTTTRGRWAGFFALGLDPMLDGKTKWARVHAPGLPLTANSVPRENGYELILSYARDGSYQTDMAALDSAGRRLDCGDQWRRSLRTGPEHAAERSCPVRGEVRNRGGDPQRLDRGPAELVSWVERGISPSMGCCHDGTRASQQRFIEADAIQAGQDLPKGCVQPM